VYYRGVLNIYIAQALKYLAVSGVYDGTVCDIFLANDIIH